MNELSIDTISPSTNLQMSQRQLDYCKYTGYVIKTTTTTNLIIVVLYQCTLRLIYLAITSTFHSSSGRVISTVLAMNLFCTHFRISSSWSIRVLPNSACICNAHI